MSGPCMCGDIRCPSCGPLQGNSRCRVCGKWADDGCDCEERGEPDYDPVEEYERRERFVETLDDPDWERQEAKRE